MRIENAVIKAPRNRMLADMRQVAQQVALAVETLGTGPLAHAYVAGLLAASPSRTVRACILTAWS